MRLELWCYDVIRGMGMTTTLKNMPLAEKFGLSLNENQSAQHFR